MHTLALGFGVALLVSIPPGANTALCIIFARDGVRRVAPIILGAAATDALYALLTAIGVITANNLNATFAHWLAAAFCVVAAVFLWSRRIDAISAPTAISAAMLNPATAALWLGLSALPVARPHGAVDLGLWVLGVAAGTTTWFSTLALLSARLHRIFTPNQGLVLERSFSIALILIGIRFVV